MLKKPVLLLWIFALLIVWNCAAFSEPVFAFENAEYNVIVKKNLDLKPILQGAELSSKAKYLWESENEEIAKVTNAGRITGISAGQTTIRVTVTDADDTSYSAECIINVIQPVTKISYEKKELKVPVGVDIKFEPTVSPENATNPKLRFTSSDSSICKISEDGIVRGNKSNKSCFIIVEATDGSNVKAKFKVNVKTFVIDEDEIVLTERKTYRLTLPYILGYDDYFFKYNRKGCIKLGNLYANQNDWYTVGSLEVLDEETNKKEKKQVLKIEPLKTGTQTLTFYDLDGTWGVGSTKDTVKITVKPSAVYGDAAFPALQYAKVAADPQSFVGNTVQVSGTIASVEKREDKTIRYSVATKGATENTVIACVPKEFAKFANFNTGEKVKIYGVWLDPESTKTETGLTVTNLVLQIEKINDAIFNSELEFQKAQ